MLEKLNDEQIKLMYETRDEFISLINKKMDEKSVTEGVKWLYSLCRLDDPKVIIVDSPLGVQFVCNMLDNQVEDQVWDRLRSQVEDQVWSQVEDQVCSQVKTQVSNQLRDQIEDQVWSQIENKVRNQMWNQVENQMTDQMWDHMNDQVWNQVWSQVGSQILDQVRSQVGSYVRNQIEDQEIEDHLENNINNHKLKYYPFSYGLMWLFGWMAFYSFFKKIVFVNNSNFEKYEKYIKSGIFMNVMFSDTYVGCKNPLYILRDNRSRMHCTDGYAIEWGDGYGQHYVNGVYFEPSLFNNIFVKKSINGKDILQMKNAEQRACAISFYGYDLMMDTLNAKLIDSSGKHKCWLYSFNTDGVSGRFLKFEDHSTGKIGTLGVPVIPETNNVIGALEWTFRLEKGTYKPEIES